MNICIFCSANDLPERYTKPAAALAQLLANGGHTMIYGGSEAGVMKLMADEVQRAGGRVVGISTERYEQYARQNLDELVVAKDLPERKATMLARSDALIVLPGGVGTLDELSEVLELKKQGKHHKPVIILNTDGFYGGLKAQFRRFSDDGFLPNGTQEDVAAITLDDLVTFADTPEAAMAGLAA